MGYNFKDPSSLLRPWPTSELQFFAEEIYALLTSSEAEDISSTPVEKRVPAAKEIPNNVIETPSINPSPRETRLAEERARSIPTELPTVSKPPPPTPVSSPPSAPSRPTSPSKANEPSTPRPTQNLLAGPEARQRERVRDSQAESISKTTLASIEENALEGAYKYSSYDVPYGPDPVIFPSSSASKVFMGKVVSGTGKTHEVRLYQSGPSGDPDSGTIEVDIPQIDDAEQIPVDTWLTGIIEFTDSSGNITFACQPAVWIA